MLHYATITDNGSREVNEDSLAVFTNGNNFGCVLCDGLGGHGMGDVASSIVCEVFQDRFMKTNDMAQFLAPTFRAAEDILMVEQVERRAKRKMKTTAVSMVTDGTTAYIGHCGDSRLYIFQRNKVKKRTLDHSVPQMLALAHDIKESEIRNHPDRNIVLKVLGIEWEENMYDLMPPIPLRKCQAFLLCSDGFWELIEETDMCALLKLSQTVDEWVNRMAEVVRRNGKDRNMDNFSAIAIWNE